MSLVAAVFALAAAFVAGLCAFADGALLGIDEEEPLAGRRARALVARRERVHRAVAFGRVIAQLLAGAATSVALVVSGWVPATLLAPLVVVFGIGLVILTEVAARAAGDALGARGLEAVAPVVEGVEALSAPVLAFGAWADALLVRLIPPPAADDDEHEDAVERFREVVDPDAAGGDAIEEAPLVHGVFSLGETKVQEIMVPRVDIVGIEQGTPWSEVADRVRSARHARLVVYDGTLDEVTGVLYAKDLLPALLAEEEPAGGWRALVRPAVFIPGTKSVEAQLREFRASRRHLAIVVDEFGGTAGLVTLEDALELIVGDIQDEGDTDRPEVERGDGGRLWVAAHVTLDVLSDLLGEELTRGDVTTVGGLVMELLGRVPRPGEALVVAGHRLVVERVVRRRIERVYLEPLAVLPQEADG